MDYESTALTNWATGPYFASLPDEQSLVKNSSSFSLRLQPSCCLDTFFFFNYILAAHKFSNFEVKNHLNLDLIQQRTGTAHALDLSRGEGIFSLLVTQDLLEKYE